MTPDLYRPADLRRACEALGIADDFSRIRRIVIDPDRVEITRYHHVDGHDVVVPGTNAMLTETESVRVN